MKIIYFLVFFLVSPLLSISSQTINIRLRDNNYANFCYCNGKGMLIGYEQSLLNVKLKEQSGRMFTGYQYKNGNISALGLIYGGVDYTNSWYVTGADFIVGITHKKLEFEISVNPNYDSDLDFQLNYKLESSISLLKKGNSFRQDILATVSYGNIPEFRDNTENVRLGLKFISNRLWVHPELTVPNITKGDGHKYIRVICSMGWSFNL